MKKYRYILSTVKTVEQTFDYEFESDEEMTAGQAVDFIAKNKVQGVHANLLDEEIVGERLALPSNFRELRGTRRKA
jgi:hypothetical protein